MGCVSSFDYQPNHFNNIKHYVEKVDSRFGKIYIFRNFNNHTSFIAKMIKQDQRDFFMQQKQKFEEVFEKNPQFILKISGYEKDLPKISRKEKYNNQDVEFLIIENFDKDLNEEINFRKLRNLRYTKKDIWNLIFFASFVFSVLEENNIVIYPIKRHHFLVRDRQLCIYLANMFNKEYKDFKKENYDKQIELQYKKRIDEFVWVLLSCLNLIPISESLLEENQLSKITLLQKTKETTDNNLYCFILDVLILNKSNIKNFSQLKNVIQEHISNMQQKANTQTNLTQLLKTYET